MRTFYTLRQVGYLIFCFEHEIEDHIADDLSLLETHLKYYHTKFSLVEVLRTSDVKLIGIFNLDSKKFVEFEDSTQDYLGYFEEDEIQLTFKDNLLHILEKCGLIEVSSKLSTSKSDPSLGNTSLYPLEVTYFDLEGNMITSESTFVKSF